VTAVVSRQVVWQGDPKIGGLAKWRTPMATGLRSEGAGKIARSFLNCKCPGKAISMPGSSLAAAPGRGALRRHGPRVAQPPAPVVLCAE